MNSDHLLEGASSELDSPALSRTFLVFDVESIGLHGEGFAVGWVVVRDGATAESGYHACPTDAARGRDADREWVQKNCPPLDADCTHPQEVRDRFWSVWRRWADQGAVLVADCAWPVEARFLAACVDDDIEARAWEGPYPLHDLASALLAIGQDPLATHDRLPDEPVHHPEGDARQSARILRAALFAAGTKQTTAVSPTNRKT